VDFANSHSGAIIQGAGVGRHVTAVGLHTWSGFRQGAPRPAQYPAITSVADHWTGIAWPAVGHMSVVIGDGNVNGGVQGGVESVRRISALDEAARKRIADAADFALASPLPAPETALNHVFAQETPA